MAAAAAATQANAAIVQITFTGSYISNIGGNHIVTDFGGDGADDIMGTSGASQIVFNCNTIKNLAYTQNYSVGSGYIKVVAQVGSSVRQASTGTSPHAEVHGLVPFMFADANIRGGMQTQGYLDVSVLANYPGESRIGVNRLIFDDATGGTIVGLSVDDDAFTEAVPEPSSLALLALGAGGLLARRRRSQAA